MLALLGFGLELTNIGRRAFDWTHREYPRPKRCAVWNVEYVDVWWHLHTLLF